MCPDAAVASASLRWSGADRPAVLAAGHSHVLALHLALQAHTKWPAAVLRHERGPVDQSYWDEVVRADPQLPLALCFRGNAANRFFLFDSGRRFTVVHPQVDNSEPYEAVPVEAVRRLIERDGEELATLLDRLAGRRVALVPPPPPKSEASIRRGLRLSTPMATMMREHGWDPESAPITRLSLRIALNAIMFDVFREIAQERGVPTLRFPDAAVAADGSLHPDYANADVTHGNDALGAMFWHVIFEHFGIEQPA